MEEAQSILRSRFGSCGRPEILLEDEAYLNVYGDQNVIFLPNLLIADNALKLIRVQEFEK
jgi:hypothetical protein